MFTFVLTILALALAECIVSYVAITIGNDAVEKAELAYLHKCDEMDLDERNYLKMEDISWGMTQSEFMRKYGHHAWDNNRWLWLEPERHIHESALARAESRICEILNRGNNWYTDEEIIRFINYELKDICYDVIFRYDGKQFIAYWHGLKFVNRDFGFFTFFKCVGTI